MAKMGRPKAESPKKKNVSFRMTKEEYEKLTKYAEEHNLTITEVLYIEHRKAVQGLFFLRGKE